ncbi:unnamed protein product [Didymodactylos carnosus]|uniref:EGF-like domain-containing protein n=1 Tax=Didymodactylos carnosus TaxID=1234261 RepID=A0A814PN94_9BILA|nr:unnamed protein product [Didymodactylos carnosus]CAF3873041.1 unnamed protein product [Didymodactylos carnosus]
MWPDYFTNNFHYYYLPYFCNRGLAVKDHSNVTKCFCPPSFYGPQCEFYSDRITVVTHLDLRNYYIQGQSTVIKVLTTFLFDDLIMDYYEFHVYPSLQTEDNYVKQKMYFLYPRTNEFIRLKTNQRSGTQLYKVRFEAFELFDTMNINPVGVWDFPIYFDNLPSFRLVKILRVEQSNTIFINNQCSDHPCGANGVCHIVINKNESYFCLCKSGYFGKHCETFDPLCSGHCSPQSICKPNYGGIITGNREPLCVCPAGVFGPTCHLRNDHCNSSPCLSNGTCYVTYEMADIQNYTCAYTSALTIANMLKRLFVSHSVQHPKPLSNQMQFLHRVCYYAISTIKH